MSLTKTVATEALMCGLKNLPLVGPAVGLVEGVHNRWKQLNTENRIARLENGWSHTQGFAQSPAYPTIYEFFDKLTSAAPDIAGLNLAIDKLQSLGTQGISVPLFENMFRDGSHWENIKNNPQLYGRVLENHDQLDPSQITVLIMPDKPRVLELAPYTLAKLLSGSQLQQPRLLDNNDVWAIPTPPTPPPPILYGFGFSHCAVPGCNCGLRKVCANPSCTGGCGLPLACIRKGCNCGRQEMCADPRCTCWLPKVKLPKKWWQFWLSGT